MFTPAPATPTTSTTSPSTSGGSPSRRTASHAITPASTSSDAPLTCADRISARPSPYVKPPRGGRAASPAATSASPIEPASVSMCAASESSASESASRPATTSTTMNATISPSATPSQRRSAPAAGACEWAWPWEWAASTAGLLRVVPAVPGLEPVAQLDGGVGGPLLHAVDAELVEDLAEPLLVELDRVAGLLARVGLLVARRVLARDYPVVFARLDPLGDLLDAPDRVAVGERELRAEAVELVPARGPLLVVVRLADERVEVELARRHAAGEHHHRAAGGERVAIDERRRAVRGQLGGAIPLQQRQLHGQQRQPGDERQPRRARELDQDQQGGPVEDVVGQDVPRLVAEHGAQLELVEQVDCARVDHDHRLSRADRRRVGERELRQVEVVALRQVEPRAGRVPIRPHVPELVVAEAHRRGQELLPVGALVAELDQLAHDHVEHRDRLERRRGGAVGRVLVGLRGQVDEALVLGQGGRHGAPDASGVRAG